MGYEKMEGLSSRYELLHHDMQQVLGELDLFTPCLDMFNGQNQHFKKSFCVESFQDFKRKLKKVNEQKIEAQRDLIDELNTLNLSLFNKAFKAARNFQDKTCHK